MPGFPRLSSVFGVDVPDLLTVDAIDAAVERNEVEQIDLDWKEADYPQHKGFELAKDVTALANTIGGILLIGVGEDGSGRATKSVPYVIPPNATERVEQILASKVFPRLHGFSVREIPAGDGLGYLVIAVPQSGQGPHAVTDPKKGAGLHYPIRLGRTTHYLTEYEVAARYRDRYASQAQTVDHLDDIHRDGVSRIMMWVSPWLTMSLTTAIKGARGTGAAAIAAEKDFLRRWPDIPIALPETTFGENNTYVVPGIRRAIAATSQTYAGRSKTPHAELHFDGSGFAATNDASPAPATRNATDGPDEIKQDLMEFRLLDLVLFLSRHAVECGASGECLLKAQQLLPQQTGTADLPMRTRVVAPERLIPQRDETTYYPPEPSLELNGKQTHASSVSASLDELTSTDPRAAIATAHALASDILGEFGIIEPMMLRPDGSIALAHVVQPLRDILTRWGTSLGVTIDG